MHCLFDEIVKNFAELIEVNKYNQYFKTNHIRKLLAESSDGAINRIDSSVIAKVIFMVEITDPIIKGRFNCYPGNNNNDHYNITFYVSLNSRCFPRISHHLNFYKAITTMAQRSYIEAGSRNYVVLITASWDADVYNEWRINVLQIKEKIEKYGYFAIFLLSGLNVTEVKIS